MPFSAYTFALLPPGECGHGHTPGHEAVCGPLPGSGVSDARVYNARHGLDLFFVVFVRAIAHTYQTLPVLGKQLLGSPLVRMQG